MTVDYFEIRPRFQKRTDESIEILREKMKRALKESEGRIAGRVDHTYITLELNGDDRHFWSPHLSISMEEEDGGTLIRGLYGPRPEIWMGFMFLYFLSGFLVMIILIIGLSQYNLGLSALILWAVPFILGGVFVLWFSSITGQKLAKPQLNEIHAFINVHLLNEAIDHEA